MSDKMRQIPFGQLMDWALTEHEQSGSIFGVKKLYKKSGVKTLSIFGETLETPFGPAAGPHTQLAQNLIAAYVAGSRFFELKTVQILDGEDLPVSKPCILAKDECYNVEWSTELYVPQALDEYIKGWFALKLLSRELGLGDPGGFVFNMSVGYDLEGIKTPKIDGYIERMKNAEGTEYWKACKAWALSNISRFKNVDKAYIESISPKICTSITLSTLHGCPPQEIERIAAYLLTEKKLHTFIKCNPTLLGYEYARKTLDSLGFDYIAFDDHHFKADLQFSDAVPMLKRLQATADSLELAFGVKITNTFPVQITEKELKCPVGSMGIPEFGTPFVRKMLQDTLPTTMEELVRISGLSHGTDVWLGNAQELIASKTARLPECICTRDDIMNALIRYGLDPLMAFKTMENVRKGNGLTPDMEAAMAEKAVPKVYRDISIAAHVRARAEQAKLAEFVPHRVVQGAYAGGVLLRVLQRPRRCF